MFCESQGRKFGECDDFLVAPTNVALPRFNWTVLGSATSIGGGLYQFTDVPVTNFFDASTSYVVRECSTKRPSGARKPVRRDPRASLLRSTGLPVGPHLPLDRGPFH